MLLNENFRQVLIFQQGRIFFSVFLNNTHPLKDVTLIDTARNEPTTNILQLCILPSREYANQTWPWGQDTNTIVSFCLFNYPVIISEPGILILCDSSVNHSGLMPKFLFVAFPQSTQPLHALCTVLFCLATSSTLLTLFWNS